MRFFGVPSNRVANTRLLISTSSLAYYELYITLGTFFRRFKQLQVDGMTRADLEFEDWFGPYPLKDSRLLHLIGKA